MIENKILIIAINDPKLIKGILGNVYELNISIDGRIRIRANNAASSEISNSIINIQAVITAKNITAELFSNIQISKLIIPPSIMILEFF